MNTRTMAVVCALSVLTMTSFGGGNRHVTFSAPADGQTLVKEQLQKAIDDVSAAGGGVVTVPKGTYLVAMIEMKSGVTLNLAKDAVLLASTNHFDYDAAPMTRYKIAVLTANGARNIAVVGEGTINGRGDACGYHEEGPNRWRLIHFRNCTGVRVEGIRLENSNYWTSFYECCRNVTLRRLTIRSQTNFNNDGIDLEVADSLVEDCDIDSDDDAVCFKSHNAAFACTNVVVRNCRIASHCNCIKFGTATYGIFRDIVVTNCTLWTRHTPGRRDWTRWPAVTTKDLAISGIALEMVDGGQFERVMVRDITIDGGVICPIFARLGTRHSPAMVLAPTRSFMRNVLVENVRYTSDDPVKAARFPILLSGVPDYPIENITLRNISIPFVAASREGDEKRVPKENEKGYPEAFMFGRLPAWGLFARHVRGLKLEGVDLRLVQGEEKRERTAYGDVTFSEWPFVYGAQYYRAPTPEREHWAKDLADLKAKGFDTVKYWVQWRWSERRQGEYYWDDLDELMTLAAKNGLKVILNLILDVMPEWVERDYPDALMVTADDRVFHGEAPAHRQLGGHPGPCYSHAAMTAHRRRFARAAYAHFRGHPALLGWDVWNEPERHYRHRVKKDVLPEICYCASCRARFRGWLARRYGTIEKLNTIWGRCYTSFDAVEAPTQPGTVTPFIDWREFQMDVLHEDADWRLADLHAVDPAANAHLHVVVACGGFSPAVAVDDYTLARKCDVFGSSMQGAPYQCAEGVSAAADRPFYNAEWHINFGMSHMYPRLVTRDYFMSEQFAQLGWGIQGFLFWQYRTECLGLEAPAWGLIRLDGRDNPTVTHAEAFIRAFRPHVAAYRQTKPEAPLALVWRGFRNETYNFARYTNLDKYHGALKQWSEMLYHMNIPFRLCDTQALEQNTWPTAKILILSEAMYLAVRDAAAFDAFVKKGGVIISEGNLGAVDADRNRFSAVIPGVGLSAQWGIREDEMTAAVHLPASASATEKVGAKGTDDLAKAIAEAGGCAHSETFSLTFADGKTVGVGGWDFLKMATDGDTETLATFNGLPVVIRRGRVYYAGTQLAAAAAAKRNASALGYLLRRAVKDVQATVVAQPDGMHVDRLYDASGCCRFVVAVNRSKKPLVPRLPEGMWKGLFGERSETPVPANTATFYCRAD